MSSTRQIKQHFCYLVSSHQYRSAEGHPPNAPSILKERDILQNRSSFKHIFGVKQTMYRKRNVTAVIKYIA